MTKPNTSDSNSPAINPDFNRSALYQLEREGFIEDIYSVSRPTATSQIVGFQRNATIYNALISYETVIGFIRYGRVNDLVYLTPYYCITNTTIRHRNKWLKDDAQTFKRNLKTGHYKMSMLPLKRMIEEMEAEAEKLSIASVSATA